MRILFCGAVLACAGWAQPTAEFLARLDRLAKTFTGAKAAIRNTNHYASGLPDDIQTGVFLLKRDSGTKVRMRIDFTGSNTYTVSLHDQLAEEYHPKLNEIHEYDIRKYKEMSQTLFLLGFGMSGKQLAANYDLRELRREKAGGENATRVELVPKSADVLKAITKIDLWISDRTDCAVQQKFYFPGGDYRLVEFSDVRVNPNIPSSELELPKGAKRVRMN